MEDKYEIKSYYDAHFAVWYEVIKNGVRVPYVGRFYHESDAKIFKRALEGKNIDPELKLWAIKECQGLLAKFKDVESSDMCKKLIKFLKGL